MGEDERLHCFEGRLHQGVFHDADDAGAVAAVPGDHLVKGMLETDAVDGGFIEYDAAGVGSPTLVEVAAFEQMHAECAEVVARNGDDTRNDGLFAGRLARPALDRCISADGGGAAGGFCDVLNETRTDKVVAERGVMIKEIA